MAELACFLFGLLIGWIFLLIADRRFARMESEELQKGMVYTIHLLPDPQEVFWKYLLQVLMHTCSGKGGRRANLTTLDATMWHGFKSSTGLFTSRKLSKLPQNAKLVLEGPCHESTLKRFLARNLEHWGLLNNCWWLKW